MVIAHVIIMFATLGQAPYRSIPEIRASLNRFDDLSQAALHAKAKQEARRLSSLPNITRRIRMSESLHVFAEKSLVVSPPWRDAELATFDNLVDDLARLYDH